MERWRELNVKLYRKEMGPMEVEMQRQPSKSRMDSAAVDYHFTLAFSSSRDTFVKWPHNLNALLVRSVFVFHICAP